MDYIKKFEGEIKKIYEDFLGELRGFKAGQASPALVEDVEVPCYDGQVMKLKQVAAISVVSPREILVQPWDKTLISNVTKAIEGMSGGVQATPDKIGVRVTLPLLTEERRREFVKLVHRLGEETRVRMRRSRDEVNKGVEEMASEDERFRTKEKIDDLIKSAQKDIDLSVAQKEKELLTI